MLQTEPKGRRKDCLKKPKMPEKSPFKHDNANDSAGFLLWKVTTLWQKKLSGVLGELGITQTQYAILASLKWFKQKGEPATQTHLAEHTKIDKMTISKAIHKLEKSGFIQRQKSSVDNRATNVRFTTKGEKTVENSIIAIENADEDFFLHLSGKQRDIYKCLMLLIITSNDK